MTNAPAVIRWTCPKCGLMQVDEIDEVDGPFVTCTCERCGGGFDQRDVVE